LFFLKVRACIWAGRACELKSGYEEADHFVQKLRSQLGEKNEAEAGQLKARIKVALAALDYESAIKLLERLEVVELVLNASAIRNRAVCWQRINRHVLAIEFYEE
jgi:tetratricopeptide (TPR) repeat protein